MAKNKTTMLISILVIVIILLLGIVLYSLVVRPGISGYIVSKQTEAYNQGIQDAAGCTNRTREQVV